jgi:hypothetical protein
MDFSSSQYRVCNDCHVKVLKETLTPDVVDNRLNTHDINDNIDLKFEVRAERLPTTTDET